MKVVHDTRHAAHDPQFFLSSGAPQPCPEKPARAEALLAATCRMGLEVIAPEDRGEAPIHAVHPERYLTFLRGIYPRWRRIEGASAEVIPNIHPDRRNVGYPASAVGQAGYHMTDTSCPIGAATWEAAYGSAQTALHAACLVQGGARAAYSLCRPPGHRRRRLPCGTRHRACPGDRLRAQHAGSGTWSRRLRRRSLRGPCRPHSRLRSDRCCDRAPWTAHGDRVGGRVSLPRIGATTWKWCCAPFSEPSP